MPDSTHPESAHGVPHGGGHKGLIAGAILMLLLAGGLVFWKIQSGDKEPEVVTEIAPPPKAVDDSAIAVENAPPPPPEEEEIKEEKTETPKAAGPTGPSGCSSACKGDAGAALRSALASRGAMARSCYNTALRNNPNLEGKMTMSVKVSPSGGVCSAYVSSNSLGDPAVASCATAKFTAGKFPAPTGGCVDVNVPLNFTAKQ